jgi:hypothetical protein
MTKLRLTEWASIAEVIGAIGVVLSLIYVGIQVRANTDEIRATNRQQLIGRAHAATNGVATSPELAATMAKLSNGAVLTPGEQVQYGFFARGLIYDVQEAFLLRQEERLDENYWQTRSALFGSFVRQDAVRSIYERDKELGILHKDFVYWADQNLANNLEL